MEFSRNPFRYGAEFGPDDIIGRSDEIAHVESVIRRVRMSTSRIWVELSGSGPEKQSFRASRRKQTRSMSSIPGTESVLMSAS